MQPSERPSSSFPGMSSPSPRKNLFTLQRLLPVAAVVVLVAAIAGIFFMARGMGSPSRQASGPVVTATTGDSATATDTGMPTDGTVTPGPTPPPTQGTSGNGNPPPTATPANLAIHVTQNQDMRPACIDETAPYTVTLSNTGTETATWHVNVPYNGGQTAAAVKIPNIPTMGLSWTLANPQDGSVAPGQTASFVMDVVWPMPCTTSQYTMYKAYVQLKFASGATQADIPLTYADTGPARYAKVAMVSGSLNITQPCPVGGAAPAPFTFALTNTGNYYAVIGIRDMPGPIEWFNFQLVKNPPVADNGALYPGQTWTVTISPHADVLCDGTVYHVTALVRYPDGTDHDIVFSDTFI